MWSLVISLLPWKVWVVIIIVSFVVLWWLYHKKASTLMKELKKDKRYCSWQEWFLQKSDAAPIESTSNAVESIKQNVSLRNNIPLVGRSKSETLAINAFAQLLAAKGADIEKLKIGYRPGFLRSPTTGKNLELDAYYPDWKIAMEYNGIQHYVFPNKFHEDTPEGERQFTETYTRDRLKRVLLNEQNICLITVPYHVDTCIECKKNPSGYRLQRHTDQQKWDRLVSFIDKKINYCIASQMMHY